MRRKSSGGIPARENTVCTGSLRNCRKEVMDGTAGRGCCRLVVGRTPGLALGLVLGAQSPGTSDFPLDLSEVKCQHLSCRDHDKIYLTGVFLLWGLNVLIYVLGT